MKLLRDSSSSSISLTLAGLSLETDLTTLFVKSSTLAEKLVLEADADLLFEPNMPPDEAWRSLTEPVFALAIIELGLLEMPYRGEGEGEGSRIGFFLLSLAGEGPRPMFSMLFSFFNWLPPGAPDTRKNRLPMLFELAGGAPEGLC